MSGIREIFELPEPPRMVVQEYNTTLEEWINIMNLSSELRNIVLSSQIVLIPEEHQDCSNVFSVYASDFYNYCKNDRGINIEICCEESDFKQLELCSFKIRLGKILATSSIAGTVFWGVISGYVKDLIDKSVDILTPTNQVEQLPAFQKEPECSFSAIVKDTTGKTIEIKYDGPVSGMDEAGDQIIKIMDNVND